MLPSSTAGRKVMMAVTGQFMIFYVIAHVLGNYSVFADTINAYAEGLRHWPYIIVLWSSRILLFISVVLHSYYGIVLKLENRKAKPETNIVQHYRSASFAGRTMIWSGIIIGLFLLYHLLHFTLQVTNPELGASSHPDSLGRPDVFTMVVRSFHHAAIAAFYVIGVLALGLHLYHGIESSIQSEGLNNKESFPVVVRTGMIAAIILFLMYAAIPVTILAGLLNNK